jgi:hypothetical protein
MVVVLVEEERLSLQGSQILLGPDQVGEGFDPGGFIPCLLGQAEQHLGVVDGGFQPSDSIDGLLQSGQALGDLAAPLGIVPEVGGSGGFFQPAKLDGLAVEVKETSAPRKAGREDRRSSGGGR